METKLCKKCNLILNVDAFRLKKDKCGKYYRYSYCKQCEKEFANLPQSKQRKTITDKTYRGKHKKEIILYQKERKKEDNLYKLKCQIRSMIWQSFNKKKILKYNTSQNILGCKIEEFIIYLLQTYKNNYGVEWDGVEEIHIDHIIPLATAITKEEVIELCHYTNLQLLKAKDNLQKYNKLNWELQK